MNKENEYKFTNPSDKKKVLNEIKHLLIKLIGGNDITFNQFTGILDKDNRLQAYNRKSLLDQRERFFKGKENKRSKRSSREIQMSLNNLVNFLDFLARNGKFDLERFKKAIIYCLKNGLVVGK